MASTIYTQASGMDGIVSTDNVEELAQQAVDAAALAGTRATAAETSATNAAGSATAAASSASSLSVDATSVAAAGALMDSEVTNLADVKALDQSVVSGAAPTFGIANMTIDNTGLVVSGSTSLQTFAEGVDDALLKARGTGFTSDYVSTAGVGGTTFAQPALNGEISSDEGYFSISYAGATGVTVANLSASSTYVYIDKTGALQQQTTAPTRQDWSRKLFTMRIAVDTVAGTILGFEYLANPIGHYGNTFRDFYSFLLAQGVPFKKGQVVTGRSDLGFDVSAGELMEYGGTGQIHDANIRSFDAVSNATYSLLSSTAVIGDQTDLVKYWDNAGTITALGSTTVVAHRLYRFSNGNFAMQYGQGNYANMTLAKTGAVLEDYDLNPRLLNATFFGWWFIQSTATVTTGTPTLTDFSEYTIGIQGGSSGGLSGCLLKGNNLSDLLDAAAARSNLALGTAATTAATDYATAAQGALAGTALQPDGDGSALTGVSGTPTGAVLWFAADAAPTGFIKANGAAISRSTYSDLFTAIGTTFGAGDGSTTFLVPDLRGEFLRGWDDARGIDGSRAFGSAQADELKSHSHSMRIQGSSGGGLSTGNGDLGSGSSTGDTDVEGGAETRGRNVALLACIKY
jgi:microcystin-dependent protein